MVDHWWYCSVFGCFMTVALLLKVGFLKVVFEKMISLKSGVFN